ncbi:Omp28-related outer membrane protein [Marinifilum flexuosum]|uniref:Thioredoxin n=1 Tax=Marinifilum flexuosum TaxID=1117708 RepID=A0A419WX54_9BACT|nr:Omp28-related outer membrane protein [Marinifilum flexuosum]RKE00073.1 thioredoxin [Marinifilum flexuosum]
MKNFKQCFLLSMLFLGLLISSCSSSGDDSLNPDPEPEPKESRKNSNVSVSSTDAPANYTTKILLEDYTGTWCGWCPGLALEMENAIEQNSNIIGIGIHVGDNMESTYAESLTKKFNVSSYPNAKINRSATWNQNYSSLESYLEKKSNLGIALNASVENEKVKGKIQIGFNSDISESLDYVILLVEDKVKADQKNFYSGNDDFTNHPLYSQPTPLKDYEHANVLRKFATDIFGDIIPEDYTKTGNVCEADFEINLDNYVVDNCYIIAFVLEKGGKNILNVQMVKVGSNQDFD